MSEGPNRLILRGIRLFITLAVPVLLLIFSIRLVMSPLFLSFEYQRPDFPEDEYGFTLEDRFTYAPLALEYLINNEPEAFLGDLTLPGEKCWPPQEQGTTCEMYGPDELRHMVDVQVVTQAAYAVASGVALLTVLVFIWLWRNPATRSIIRSSLMQGSILTLAIIATIVVIAVGAWEYFFDTFHEIFFQAGTWRFFYSDTLIRLFPEQFWFDAAITAGILTTLGAIIIFAATWWGGNRVKI